MSCEAGVKKVGLAAQKSGVSKANSKAAFTAGGTRYVSGLTPQKKKAGQRKRADSQKEQAKGVSKAQLNFFELSPEQPRLPSQHQIKLSDDFSPDDLQRLSVQLRLGAAALARHIREVNSGARRGLGHSDPRPLDWAELDRAQYQFLIDQLTEARRGRGYLDTSGLKSEQVGELWQFARFEADRAHRNIDHLATPGSPVTPAGRSEDNPTAQYLTSGHKLEARFYSFLAGQLEIIIPADALSSEGI